MARYYNPKPVRDLLRLAAIRRIDIAGIWNSEGNYLGHGIENGMFNALWPRFPCYGMPMMSFLPSDPGNDATYDQQIGPNWGSGGVEDYWHQAGDGGTLYTLAYPQRASAPAAVRTCFDVATLSGTWGSQFPLYLSATAAGRWQAQNYNNYTTRRNPINIANALTCTVWSAQFSSGGGSFAAVLRDSDTSPNIINLGTISCAGLDGGVTKTEGTAAADSARSSWGGLQFFANTFVNKVFASWWRWAETTKTAGFALHPLYSKGSMSAYDMYTAIFALPQNTWNHIFDVMTAYQGADLSQHVAIFDINEGANQAGEGSVAGGAPQPGDSDHPDNLVWYMLQIVAQIQSFWDLSGRSLSNIAFNLRVTHPINDDTAEAEMATYRTALKAIDFTANPRVTVMDMAEIASRAEMVASSDYQDATHLAYSGYLRVERKAWRGLLGDTTWRGRGHGRTRLRGRRQ